jgi:hypothetical protein
MLWWKLFDFAPNLLALCYHHASSASSYCSCNFSPPSIPSYPVFYAQVGFRATFVSRRGAIIDLYIATLKRGASGLDAEFFIVLPRIFLALICSSIAPIKLSFITLFRAVHRVEYEKSTKSQKPHATHTKRITVLP